MPSNKVMIYLASQSPRRRHLLQKNGYSCRVISSSYIETHRPQSLARDLVRTHARGKLAKADISNHKARFIVAADTVVSLNNRVYGKPKNKQDAEKMLFRLSGQVHEVYTAWAMKDLKLNKSCLRCVKTKVKLKAMTKTEIRSYFKRMNPLDKAGSYAIQSHPTIVESIDGSYSNVMGFPMEDFQMVISRWK